MTRIGVPQKYHEGLKKILALSDDIFEKLIEAVSDIPVKIDPKDDLLETIAKVPEIPSDDAEVMANVLLSFCANRGSSEKETKAFVEDIHSLEKSLGLSKEEWVCLKGRLTKLLDIEPLIIATKATTVMYEYERAFGRTRILTDVRPIFDTKRETSPQAAIIVHNLNIHYHQNGEHKEFFVAMDDDDIQALLTALQRAQIKSRNLKQALEKTQLKCIESS